MLVKYPSSLSSYELPYAFIYLLSQNIYASLTASDKVAVSPVVSLNFFSNGVL